MGRGSFRRCCNPWHRARGWAILNPCSTRRSPSPRRFNAEYKLRIFEEANRLTESGAVSPLLRRESLYSSHLVDWRRQYRLGALSSLAQGGDIAAVLEHGSAASDVAAQVRGGALLVNVSRGITSAAAEASAPYAAIAASIGQWAHRLRC